MPKEPRRYFSYLLRLWQTGSDEEQVWRASLESPGSEKRRGFSSLEALFDFLKAQVEPQKEHDRHLDMPGGAGGEDGESKA
jgi:hypothetical protein